MPEYDAFGGAYQRWSATAHPYGVVEAYTFFRVLGSVRGLHVLDLATGEGSSARMLMERGAASVVGADISAEMVRRATEQNAPQQVGAGGSHARAWESLRYIVLDARDETYRLEPPVDLVSAMYLLHYAPSEDDLERMGRLIARNLKPGGRFVTYTLSPD